MPHKKTELSRSWLRVIPEHWPSLEYSRLMAVRRFALSTVALAVAATLTACGASGRAMNGVVVCSATKNQRTPSCFQQSGPVSTSHARGCRVSPGPRWCLTYASTRQRAERDLQSLLIGSR